MSIISAINAKAQDLFHENRSQFDVEAWLNDWCNRGISTQKTIRLSLKIRILDEMRKQNGPIEYLDLSGLYLTELPPFFSKVFQNLRILNLSHNEFRNPSTYIDNQPELEELDLRANEPLELSPELMIRLPSLKHLDVSGCILGSIPPEIDKLTRLRSLNLSDNNLNDLPDEICNLKFLNSINLRNNLFTEFPYNVNEIKSLEYMDINENPIPHFNQIKQQIREGLRTQGKTADQSTIVFTWKTLGGSPLKHSFLQELTRIPRFSNWVLWYLGSFGERSEGETTQNRIERAKRKIQQIYRTYRLPYSGPLEIT